MNHSVQSIASPSADVISPAEAKFWQEWADKAPAIIRQDVAKHMAKANDAMIPYTVGSIALGALLSLGMLGAKGKWGKGLFAAGSAAGVAGGLYLHFGQRQRSVDVGGRNLKCADEIENNPVLREELARVLEKTITAEDIQRYGIEEAVGHAASSYINHLTGFGLGSDSRIADIIAQREAQGGGIAHHRHYASGRTL